MTIITSAPCFSCRFLAVAFSASAQTATPNIDQRQTNFSRPGIEQQGDRTLSKREAARMSRLPRSKVRKSSRQSRWQGHPRRA